MHSWFHLVWGVETPVPLLHCVDSTYEEDVEAVVAGLCAQSFAPVLLHEVQEELGCVSPTHGENDVPGLLVIADVLNVVCNLQIRRPFFLDKVLTLAPPEVLLRVQLVVRKSGHILKTMWWGPQCALW